MVSELYSQMRKEVQSNALSAARPLEEPVNDTAVCIPQCLERFFEDVDEEELLASDSGYGADGSSVASSALATLMGNGSYCYAETCHVNLTDCQLLCDAECLVVRSSNCSSLCDHHESPTVWNGCIANCVANASAACAQAGSAKNTYGFPMPYDRGGYYTSDDFHAAAR